MKNQTKFFDGVASLELRSGVSNCDEQFFVRELLTWFPLNEDAKEVTVLLETLRDTVLFAVIVVMLFIRKVCCLIGEKEREKIQYIKIITPFLPSF